MLKKTTDIYIMGRSTRKIIPVLSSSSDDSMYDATPVRDPFFRTMAEYQRRVTLHLPHPIVNNGYESSNESGGSVRSETSYQYNERIKCQIKCFKCCSVLSVLGCLVGVSMA